MHSHPNKIMPELVLQQAHESIMRELNNLVANFPPNQKHNFVEPNNLNEYASLRAELINKIKDIIANAKNFDAVEITKQSSDIFATINKRLLALNKKIINRHNALVKSFNFNVDFELYAAIRKQIPAGASDGNSGYVDYEKKEVRAVHYCLNLFKEILKNNWDEQTKIVFDVPPPTELFDNFSVKYAIDDNLSQNKTVMTIRDIKKQYEKLIDAKDCVSKLCCSQQEKDTVHFLLNEMRLTHINLNYTTRRLTQTLTSLGYPQQKLSRFFQDAQAVSNQNLPIQNRNAYLKK